MTAQKLSIPGPTAAGLRNLVKSWRQAPDAESRAVLAEATMTMLEPLVDEPAPR